MRQELLKNRESIMGAWPVIERAMQPTSTVEINTVIETLTQMFYERERDDEQYDLWLDAFTRALKNWPTDLLWHACDKWIESGPSRMPSPSDLRRHIEKTYVERFTVYARAKEAVKWLEANPDEKPFVESAETRKMTGRIKNLLSRVGETIEDESEIEKADRKELYRHRGVPQVDEKLAQLDALKAHRRAKQRQRNDQFLSEHNPIAPSITNFIKKHRGD